MQQQKISATTGRAFYRTLILTVLTAGIVTSQGIQAQGIVAPEPIKQDGRFMPGFAGDTIVRLRYSVKADGTTADVEVFPVMPKSANPMMGNMMGQTVKKWTFKPASLNGNPIEIKNQEILMVTRQDPNAPQMQTTGGGARIQPTTKPKDGAAPTPPPVTDPALMPPIPLVMSEGVNKTLQEINEMATNKEYDKALSAAASAESKGLHRVLDFAALHQTRSVLYVKKNQSFEALDALNLATLYSINAKGEKVFMLDPVNLESALRQKIAIAFSLRHHAEAQEAFALLKEKYTVADDDKINDFIKSSKAMMDSPDTLAMLARIPEKESLTYPLSRRVFTVADVKGKLSTITARCERKNQELKYQDNQDWALPASWGKCVLDFEGKEGTTFTLYESNPQAQ